MREELLRTDPITRITVYKGRITPDTPVAIQEEVFDSLQCANSTVQKAIAMSALVHPGVLKVYDCFIEQEKEKFRSVLAVELTDRDLEQEIGLRRENGDYWKEVELINALRSLVEALSFAQKQGVSHHNIHPGNIMLTGFTLKIANFASPIRNLNVLQIREILQSNTPFLSPELKHQYLRVIKDQSSTIHYDPVKSDVYSLGMTILAMASLEEPANLTNWGQLNEEIEGGYLHLQHYLRWMMEEVEKRATFVELEQHLEQYKEYFDELMPGNRLEMLQKTIILRERTAEKREIEPQDAPKPAETAQNLPNIPQIAQNVQIPGSAPQIQCAICLTDLPSKRFRVPKDLKIAKEYLPSVCSAKCLRKMSNLREIEGNKCCNCGIIGEFQSPFALQCGHKFHDLSCLFLFLHRWSSPERENRYQCPVCGRDFTVDMQGEGEKAKKGGKGLRK
jgi:serine/threonine protein kinase